MVKLQKSDFIMLLVTIVCSQITVIRYSDYSPVACYLSGIVFFAIGLRVYINLKDNR